MDAATIDPSIAPDPDELKSAGWFEAPAPATPPPGPLPRDESAANSGSSANTPPSGATAQSSPSMPPGREVLLTDANKPPISASPFQNTKEAYQTGSGPVGLGASFISDMIRNSAFLPKTAVQGAAEMLTQPVSQSVDDVRKGAQYLMGNTTPSANPSAGEIPQSIIASMVQPPPGQSPSPHPASPSITPPPNPASPSITPPPNQSAATIPAQQAPQMQPPAQPPAINPQSIAASLIQPPSQVAQSPAPQLWNDLPDWRKAQLLQQMPDQPNVPELYNQAVMAKAGPSVAPATPDAMMQLASRGILPAGTGSTINMGQAAQALNERMKGFYGGGAGGGGMVNTLTDSQGIPYAKIMPIWNPMTGSMEMKQVDIPADARNTVSGLPQGALQSITDLGDKFASQELPKTFYGQIAPKYQSIVNLLGEAKKTGDYNNFRSMDVLNSYAGITRPGAVVKDSTIATDLEGSGLPNEVARNWEAFVKGQGVLSPKDLTQIESSARDSYNGYKQQVDLAKRPVLMQANIRTGIDPKQLEKLMFPPSPGDEGQSSAQGNEAPATNLPEVSNPDDYNKLPPGSQFTTNGKTYTKPQ